MLRYMLRHMLRRVCYAVSSPHPRHTIAKYLYDALHGHPSYISDPTVGWRVSVYKIWLGPTYR